MWRGDRRRVWKAPTVEEHHDEHTVLGTGFRRPGRRGSGDRRGGARRARPAARRAAADREREPHLARPCSPRSAPRCRTSTPRATRAGATTAAAPRSTRPRRSASPGPRSSSAPTTPTCSRTPGPAPTSPPTPRSSARRHGAGDGLPHGGHLTHGSQVNFSGKWFHTGRLRGRRGHRAHRLRRGPRPGPRAPAEDDHLRRDGVPAADRLRARSGPSPTRSAPS